MRNPDLDVVQQLADGTVRLSFDQSRFRSPLEYDIPSPRSSLDLHQDTYQEPRSRSVDLRQPFRQPAILLKDRPASHCSSSRTRAPSRKDSDALFQGVKDHSQVSTPCYTAKQDSVADQEEDSNSQDSLKPPSPSGSDFRNPIQQESEYDHQLLMLTKEFIPDMDMFEKEFNSEENRVKREAYRANHTKEQKVEVLEKWKLFMKEVKADYPFFEYLEKHFKWHKKSCVKTKLHAKTSPPTKPRHSTQEVENPVSPSPVVNVLEAHISSSSPNELSSESEKEKEPLDNQLGDTPPLPPKKWISKYRGNPGF